MGFNITGFLSWMRCSEENDFLNYRKLFFNPYLFYAIQHPRLESEVEREEREKLDSIKASNNQVRNAHSGYNP